MPNSQNSSSPTPARQNHPEMEPIGQPVDQNSSTGGGRRRTGIRIVILLALMAAAVGIVYGYWYKNLRGYISTDDAFIESDQVDVGSKILGRITQLSAEEGDTIKEGQWLVQLDDSDLKAQEEQNQAGLESAQRNVNLVRVSLGRVLEDLDRAALQIKDRVITQEQYDHARKAVDIAQAQLELAGAQVNTSKAQLAVVQTQIKNTQIFAHSNGVIARKWTVVGDVIQPGQPIYTLYDLERVWIRANIEETKIAAIQPHDPVQISVDAYRNRTYEGSVELIGSVAASQFSLIPPNNASGNFTKVTQRVPIKISLNPAHLKDAAQYPLRPGMSVVIKIQVKKG
jgi:membrane fusion protein (multidrug efflux system)